LPGVILEAYEGPDPSFVGYVVTKQIADQEILCFADARKKCG
jgi:hypothetical protein